MLAHLFGRKDAAGGGSGAGFVVVLPMADVHGADAAPVSLRFPRAQMVTVAAVQGELDRLRARGWRVTALRSDDGFLFPAQPSGVFFIDSEAELRPGTYEARLSDGSHAVHDATATAADDALPRLVIPWDDVGRAQTAIEALLSDAPPPPGVAPPIYERVAPNVEPCESSSRAALAFFNDPARLKQHDFFAAAVSRAEATLRYLVAVSDEAVVVAIDCVSNGAQLRALLDPGVPSRVGEFGSANTAAVTLAQHLPINLLLELCRKPQTELIGTPVNTAVPAAAAGAASSARANPIAFIMPQHPSGSVRHSTTTAFVTATMAATASAAGVGGESAASKRSNLGTAINNMVGISAVRSLGTRKLRAHTPPAVTPSKPAKSDDRQQQPRRLIFCGHSVSGAVAHMAAVFARYASVASSKAFANSRRARAASAIHVRAVTFSSPCCMSSRLADNLAHDGFAVDHVTFMSDSDPLVEMATLAAEVSGARALQQDTSADAYRIVGVTERLIKMSTSGIAATQSEMLALESDVRNAAAMVRANELDAADVRLSPFGAHVFREQRGMMAMLGASFRLRLEKGGNDAVRGRMVHAYSSGKSSSVALRNHMEPLATAFLSDELEAEVGHTVLLSYLVPSLTKCTVTNVTNTSRHDFVLAGRNLEPIIGRASVNGAMIPGSKGNQPLLLQIVGDHKDDVEGMFVQNAATEEARIVAVGCYFTAPGPVVLRTDFGDTAAFIVQTVHHTQGQPPSAMLYASVNRELLEGAFLRGMLAHTHAIHTRRDRGKAADTDDGWVNLCNIELPPMLRMMADLEDILLGTKETWAICAQYNRADQIYVARADFDPVVSRMLAFMSHPVSIEFYNRFTKGLQRVIGAIGVFLGGVLTIAGTVALLPALIPAAAVGAVVYSNSQRNPLGDPFASPAAIALLVPTVLLMLPGGLITAIGSTIVSRGMSAIQDPPSRQYLQMLKLLLITMGGDPDLYLEEIPSLEVAIHEQWRRIASSTSQALHEVDVKEIKAVLDERQLIDAISDAAGEKSVYRRATEASRLTIARWLAAVGRFGRLRRLFQRQIVLSFVGVHNAGKSTMVNKLFGVNSKADLIERTEAVQMFHLGGDLNMTDDDDLCFEIADFPGATDERAHIANVTQRMADITTFFICLFSIGHVAEPERRIVDMIRAKNKEFLVFINKTDAYTDELRTREVALRENYATALGVDQSQIIFTSAKIDERVEYVRKLLFATLSLYVGDELSPQLAMAMLSPAQQRLLEPLLATHNLDKVRFAVMKALLDIDATVTSDNVKRHLQDARPANGVHFPPTLVRRAIAGRQIGRCVSMGIRSETTRAAYDFTVDLLARMGYQPGVIMVTLKVIRSIFEHNRTEDEVEIRLDVALADITRDPMKATRPEGQEVLMLIVQVTKHITAVIQQFAEMGYDEHTVIQAISNNAYPGGDLEALNVETLLGAVEHEKQMQAEQERLEAAAQAAALQEGSDESAVSSSTSITAMPPATPAPAPQPAVLFRLQGIDNLTLLLSRSKFKVTDRVTPRALYPRFKSTMAFDERMSMFYELLCDREANADGVNNSTTGIEILPDEHMFDSFMKVIDQLSPAQLRSGIKISIEDNEAVDAKGVLRSVMTVVANKLREDGSKFVSRVSNGNIYFAPHGYGHPADAAEFYLRLGRVVGVCLMYMSDNVRLSACISLPMCKLLLGETLGFGDFEILDPDAARSIRQMCLMDDETFNDLGLTFSADAAGGETYNLVEDGANVPVTVENRLDYLLARVWFHVGRSLPLQSFVLGVSQSIPRDFLAVFTPSMLQMALNGETEFAVADLRAATHYDSALQARPQLIEWFWECVEAMSAEDRGLLLAFVTGSASVPPAGIGSIQLSLVLYSRGSAASLPLSHTCFNMLELPPYESREQLAERVLVAIRNTSVGQFGFM